MKTETCVHCDESAIVTRKNYPLPELGVPVELQNVEVIECPSCGSEEPVIPNMDGLMLTLALAITCSPRKLNGNEVRFLRKYVGKSASDFSRFLHVDPTHLSKIENGRVDIGAGLDKLVRLLVVNMSSDLKEGVQRLMSEGSHELQVDPSTMSCHYAIA
jgi:DNA-binding transcriptional regulator YiaG